MLPHAMMARASHSTHASSPRVTHTESHEHSSMLFALSEDVIARFSIFSRAFSAPAAAARAFAAADACECAGACETTAHTQANA